MSGHLAGCQATLLNIRSPQQMSGHFVENQVTLLDVKVLDSSHTVAEIFLMNSGTVSDMLPHIHLNKETVYKIS